MLNRLADQHTVKWIAVNKRKFRQVRNSILMKRQTLDNMALPLNRQIDFSGFWKGQLPYLLFDNHFPKGYHA